MSVRLYVGNLPKEEIDRQELQAVFAEAGDSISTKVIKDRKTGKCRGFGFVTVQTDEQADQFIEKFNGYVFKESALKIEKALPRSKGQSEEEAPPPPVAKSAPSSSSAPSEKSRRNKKKNRGGSSGSSSTTSTNSEAVQPDPRWAQELEKLKQMLAAQTTNP
ncbi:RNA-binding protein [Planktothrix sp. FACHB-1355]|uniref:RNA-binding protein n=1 Tax=Aerosakkonema funiforme FACHB-1375 TaxID=2949571 RepID=A0A926VIJ9_9CYAN|nr:MULTISPECIES: RNA-binding protein [Oscillatoriales]MBD2183164.1 RNA-binding protein [Aerosakkonema funiforme FACHB-1375]MBD3561285.1 RNA-binding protein [Planktothrix sp. FACHB-1355]